MRKLLSLLLAGLQMISFSHAAVGEKADFSSLNRVPFHQGKVTPNDLKGKVVFIEYWGLQCPPCRAAMPKLQALYEKYKDRGFVLIASHCQLAGPDAINSYFSQNHLTFSSCSQFMLPQGSPQGGIPFSVLVGRDGKVVAMGYPSSVETKVAAEIEKMDFGDMSENAKTQYTALLGDLEGGRPDVEAKVEALRNKSNDKDAASVCDAFDKQVESKKASITKLRDTDALQFVSQAKALKKSLPSTKDFDEDVSKLTSKPAYSKLAEIQKKKTAMSKKIQDGKKVSPKAVESLISSVDTVSSKDEGLNGSANILKRSLKDLAETVKKNSTESSRSEKKQSRGSRRDTQTASTRPRH